MMRIEDWRAEIDVIDGELLRLVNRRARIARKLGRLKSLAGLPVEDPERERDVLARTGRANVGPLDERAVARIFRRIIRETRRAEKSPASVSPTGCDTPAAAPSTHPKSTGFARMTREPTGPVPAVAGAPARGAQAWGAARACLQEEAGELV